MTFYPLISDLAGQSQGRARYRWLPNFGAMGGEHHPYPWIVYDFEENRIVAELYGQRLAEIFAEQLNARGFVQL